jgi:predicted XRE-type DNA-binding protein
LYSGNTDEKEGDCTINVEIQSQEKQFSYRQSGTDSYIPLGAKYEDEHMQFKHLKVRRKSPLIRSIKDEMYSYNIKQKELADMLGINEPTLSQIMRQKRPIYMRMAKKLHKSLIH